METPASPQEAIAQSDDWQTAVTDLIDYYTAHDMCFSSGEVARELRLHRPDFRFSVFWVGDRVRDLFYSAAILYKVQGNTGGDEKATAVPAFQVTRITEGLFPLRTPAGLPVFVYGPHPSLCEKHSFEVEIPQPPRSQPPNDWETNKPPEEDEDEEWTEDERAQSHSRGDFTVRIHADKRMCFTRPIMDAFFHATQKPYQAGTSVHLRIDDASKVVVTLNATADTAEYQLNISRGRVLYPSPGKPFNPGDLFKVDITPTAIIVGL